MFPVPEDRAELSSLENMLLWSMRAWAIVVGKRLPGEDRIVRVFARIGAAEAAGQMHGFILVLAHGASRMIDLECVCKRQVSRDERNLIAVLALAQHRRFGEALTLLRTMAGAGAAASALDCACRVMDALSAAGWFLSSPDADDWQRIGVEPARDQTVTLH